MLTNSDHRFKHNTVILRFTSSRLTLFRFTSSNFLFPLDLRRLFFGTNCDVNRGITVKLLWGILENKTNNLSAH